MTTTDQRAALTMQAARALYRAGNDAGHGYDPSASASDTVQDVVRWHERRGGRVLLARETSDDVAVVQDRYGDLVAIGGDALGREPWAVRIKAPEVSP